MIYLLSDLHADSDFLALKEYVKVATDDDLLIILGDIGLKFEKTEDNKKFDEFFMGINKNIAFIDGNHENFDYLDSFPETEWNGGIVGKLSDKIFYLKRGNIYNINGKTFFVFGGCKSSSAWKQKGLWYPGEEPTDEQLELAYSNLEKSNMKVDYILTHRYNKETEDINGDFKKLNDLTQFIDNNVSYKKWYCGHWHQNKKIDDKHICVYDILTTIE